ncbi:protein Spindly [Anopheles stephensi]|uniref:protein Spindly n=1 Tax=Anopheles stephensi TaxID=30069 RepID=UPI0007D21770|nr:protein Spindly [Anopheles stephensi]
MEMPASSKQLQTENEELRQQLHVYRNKYEVANKTIIDLSEELEQMVAKSAEEKKHLRFNYEEQLKAQKSIIDQLKAKVEERIEVVPAIDSIPDVPTAISDPQQPQPSVEQDWENEEKRYVAEIELLQEQIVSTTNELQRTRWEMSKANDELQMAKEQIESKQADLLNEREIATELRTLLEAAQQQSALLSAELAGIRSGTSNENTKGNSLFGEVADQRSKVLKTFSTLKAAHLKLKQEHADCPRQIRELRDLIQQSERLYGQCLKLMKAAENDALITLREQNGELHEQLEKALGRVRYLEHEMATNSADWVNKLVLYYTEEMQKLELRLRTCQFRQREAMELRQDAVKDAWTWRLEAQRLRANNLNVDREGSSALLVCQDPAVAEKFEKQEESEVPDCEKENIGVLRAEPPSTTHSNEAESSDETCSTVPSAENTATIPPKAGGALQESKQQKNPEPDAATIRIVPWKCYKISDLKKIHYKELNQSDAENRTSNEDTNEEKPQ